MRSALTASRLRPRWSPAILSPRSSAAASNTVAPRLRPQPSLGLDLYRRADAHDREADYRAVRDAGPAVWLTKHRMWAMGRYDDVRAALKDDATYLSGNGIAANPIANRLGRRTVISSDGPTHLARRKILMESLSAKALGPVRSAIEREADAVVAELSAGGGFDGVGDFASRLPLRVVADLVGVRVDKDQLLRWGRRAFDGVGPLNRRGLDAAPSALGLRLYTARLNNDRVVADSWAARVFAAADRGEISIAEARTIIIDFIAPSLDTTILAVGQMLWSLGTTAGAWNTLRDDPALIPAAVVESVRLASPIRGFTRTISRDVDIDDARLKRGQRVILLYASANRDETKFEDPDSFRLDRLSNLQLGWGFGPHACVGMHLAKLEMQALLHAMVPRVASISVSDPRPLANNCLQGFQSFRAHFA
jgi:cytochrome P450